MTDPMDLRLRDLLAPPERAPDEAFVSSVSRAILAEERLRAASRAAWRRFAVEAAAVAAALTAFALLTRLTPAVESEGVVPLFSPAAAGILAVFLLLGAGIRPGQGWSSR
jgi:hypothetical protein